MSRREVRRWVHGYFDIVGKVGIEFISEQDDKSLLTKSDSERSSVDYVLKYGDFYDSESELQTLVELSNEPCVKISGIFE